MNVGQICKRNAVTVRPSDELNQAAKLMKDQHVGYLVVVKQASPKAILKPVGVLTGRDIAVAVVASGVDPSTLTVADVMTSDPVLAHTTDEIEESLPRMRKAARF